MANKIFIKSLNVSTYASLPTNVKNGTFAYADDTQRHYMFVSPSWYQIPNSTELAQKTAVRFWDAWSFKNGTANTGDMIIFTDSTTIAGGAGVATFYLTSDQTSTGTALCSSILINSVRGSWTDDQANYNPGTPTVAGNLKSVTVKTTKQLATGITLLSTTVIGSVTYPSAPNGTVVTLFAIGIAA